MCMAPQRCINQFDLKLAIAADFLAQKTEINSMRLRPLPKIRAQFMTLWMILCLGVPAIAHNGPPFRVITEQRAGPCIVSVWAHANIGTSPFFVMLSPLPSGHVPDDLKIEIAVQPADGRTPEKRYVAIRDSRYRRGAIHKRCHS